MLPGQIYIQHLCCQQIYIVSSPLLKLLAGILAGLFVFPFLWWSVILQFQISMSVYSIKDLETWKLPACIMWHLRASKWGDIAQIHHPWMASEILFGIWSSNHLSLLLTNSSKLFLVQELGKVIPWYSNNCCTWLRHDLADSSMHKIYTF